MCANFQQKWITLTFLAQICPKIGLGLEIHVERGISILEILFVPIFKQKKNLFLFRPKFAQDRFWDQNFRNLSLDSESAPTIYHACQFSIKMDNFEFFGLNLGKLPNYVQYFGSNNTEGVAKSRVEAEMSWVEVEMSWVEVDVVGWSWVEVHGIESRWVHGLVIPANTKNAMNFFHINKL